MEDAARLLGLQIQLFGLKSPDDFEPSFEAAKRWRADLGFSLAVIVHEMKSEGSTQR